MGGQGRSEKSKSEKLMAIALLLMVAGLASCDSGSPGMGEAQAAGADGRWSYQDWPTGPYQVALD